LGREEGVANWKSRGLDVLSQLGFLCMHTRRSEWKRRRRRRRRGSSRLWLTPVLPKGSGFSGVESDSRIRRVHFRVTFRFEVQKVFNGGRGFDDLEILLGIFASFFSPNYTL
jgi:hypothetical protein